MWDFSFAIPSLFIILIILGFYYSLPSLPIHKNRIFLILLSVEGIEIFLDIFSSLVDSAHQDYPIWFVYLVNILYFVFFYYRVFIYFMLLVSALDLLPVRRIWMFFFMHVPYLVCAVLAVSSPWTHAIFSITENGYQSGPWYNCLYWAGYFYCVLSIGLVIAYFNRIANFRHWLWLLLYTVILTIGLTVRWMKPQMLLFDTFCVMDVLIAYLALRNPEFYLERGNAVFNR